MALDGVLSCLLLDSKIQEQIFSFFFSKFVYEILKFALENGFSSWHENEYSFLYIAFRFYVFLQGSLKCDLKFDNVGCDPSFGFIEVFLCFYNNLDDNFDNFCITMGFEKNICFHHHKFLLE